MPAGSFNAFVEQKLGKFPHFLIYVILEWLMIILLFVDGFLSFISNEFAKFVELTTPCLLCTRIDHVLVHKDSNCYYNDSLCEVHKKDISSLAYCHVHKKLSDIRNICDGCLLSFATEKDSDSDKYKSIAEIFQKDTDFVVEDDKKLLMKPLKKDELDDGKGGIPCCSCCGEPLKLKTTKYRRSLSINAPAPSPSPRAPMFTSDGRLESPRVRYAELKFVTDTESEIPEVEVSSKIDDQGRDGVKAVAIPPRPDGMDINDDINRTPSFTKGNRFFGISLSDHAQMSPRWGHSRSSKKLSVDRLDFTLDPNEISALNEVDTDIVSRLKKQIRMDRNSLMALYMELDEERSASAVAANNAMAMITRLQAEKAAVQMEALQYQRMMEEQEEYDQEALQVMKDLLMKREEDIKALESELDMYREKYGQVKRVGSEICEVDADDDYQDMKSQSSSPFGEKSLGGGSIVADQDENEHPYERSTEYGGGNSDESSLDFDAERSFLLGLLSDLEKKIHPSTNEGLNLSESGGEIKPDEKSKGNENTATLTREVSSLKERLRAVEAESGFLKHAAMTLQRGGEGTKLLTEIAQHLRQLRHSGKLPQ